MLAAAACSTRLDRTKRRCLPAAGGPAGGVEGASSQIAPRGRPSVRRSTGRSVGRSVAEDNRIRAPGRGRRGTRRGCDGNGSGENGAARSRVTDRTWPDQACVHADTHPPASQRQPDQFAYTHRRTLTSPMETCILHVLVYYRVHSLPSRYHADRSSLKRAYLMVPSSTACCVDTLVGDTDCPHCPATASAR